MKQKLLKLLELSRSKNDNEALASLKKANELIKKENTTYSEVFKDKIIYKNENDIFLERELLKNKLYFKQLQEELTFLKTLIKFLVIGLVITIGYIIIF